MAPSCIPEQKTCARDKPCPVVLSFPCPTWGRIHPWKSVCPHSITCLCAQLRPFFPSLLSFAGCCRWGRRNPVTPLPPRRCCRAVPSSSAGSPEAGRPPSARSTSATSVPGTSPAVPPRVSRMPRTPRTRWVPPTSSAVQHPPCPKGRGLSWMGCVCVWGGLQAAGPALQTTAPSAHPLQGTLPVPRPAAAVPWGSDGSLLASVGTG